MKKNIEKIIIIILIVLGVVFVWTLKNRDNSEYLLNTQEAEEPEVEEEVKQEVEEPEVEEVEQEAEEPEVVEKVEIEEPKNEKQEIDINDANFDLVVNGFDLEKLKSYKLPILIDFGADWCGPCQMMEPILHELNSELRGKAIIKFVDVGKYPQAADGFNFSLIPTQFFFDKEGNLYKSHTGYLSKEDIITILKEMGMEE